MPLNPDSDVSSSRQPAVGGDAAPGDDAAHPPHETDRQAGSRGPSGGRARRIGGRLAAALAGLVVPLLVLELLFRYVGAIAPGEYQTTQLVMASEAFGRQNMANRAGWKRSDEFSAQVRVNSKGLRGPEIAYEKPPGVYRVLVIGDSFTFGAQVDEEQTFVALLEQELQTAVDGAGNGPREIETINAGVDGWTTANELAWLTSEGLRYEPDLVVLMFFTGNDPGENYDMMKAVKRVGVELDPAAGLPAREIREQLAGASTLYAFLETGIIAKLSPGADPSNLAELSETTELRLRRSTDPDRKDAGWQLSGDLLRQLREVTDSHPAQLLVVGIPTVEHVVNADRPPTPFPTITEAAGAPALDLLMPFRSLPDEVQEALYFKKDRHWTPTGHIEAARLIAAEILTHGPLEASAPR